MIWQSRPPPIDIQPRTKQGAIGSDDGLSFRLPRVCPEALHGTSSAGLVPILVNGLVPTGKLLDAGKVPFSGELEWGVGRNGVNNVSISLSPNSGVDPSAIRYASDSAENAWALDKSDYILQRAEAALADGQLGQERRFRAERAILIEILRQKQFPALSWTEQQLVLYPFPIVIGVALIEIKAFRDGCNDECICDGAPPSKCAVFVPNAQLEYVRSIAKVLSSDCAIHPLTELSRPGSDGIRRSPDLVRSVQRLSRINVPWQQRDAIGRSFSLFPDRRLQAAKDLLAFDDHLSSSALSRMVKEEPRESLGDLVRIAKRFSGGRGRHRNEVQRSIANRISA
jgi:hypothetical protein